MAVLKYVQNQVYDTETTDTPGGPSRVNTHKALPRLLITAMFRQQIPT